MTSVDAGLERLVLAYLEKRGFSQTSRQLRSEATALNRPMSLGPSRDTTGVASDLLFFLAADGQAPHYVTSFDRLAAWVDNSLDQYRAELIQMLYPIFIHCYLYLVKNDAVSNATQLFSRHSTRFGSPDGQPSKARMQELNELKAATLPEHLSSNRIAVAVRGRRLPITLSSYSHELLLNYLQASRLILILGIVNDHLRIEIREGAPQSVPNDGKSSSLIGDTLSKEASKMQMSDLDLNLLKDLAEDRLAGKKATQHAEDTFDVDENGKPLTKKARAAKQKAAQREKEAQVARAEARMTPEIPLPVTMDRLEEARIAEIEARAQLSSDALPSAAFFTFAGNTNNLNCCAFASDCSLVAGGFGDASVRTVDLRGRQSEMDGEARQDMKDFVGHSGSVFGVDFAPDHPLLLSCSADSTIRLWHLDLGACLNSHKGHNFPVWDVKFGPFGHYFASSGADKTCRIWSVERNSPLRVLAGHHSDVETVRWHPNHHYLATGSSDTSIRIWDMRDGATHRILSGHKVPVTALAFHPEGSILASADEDGQIIIWDLGEAKQLHSSALHKGPVWSLSYSFGQDPLLASGGSDHNVRIWQHGDGEGTNERLQNFTTFSSQAVAVHTCFTPRNLLLCAGERIFKGP